MNRTQLISDAMLSAVDGCEYMLRHLAEPNTEATFASGLANFLLFIEIHDPNMTLKTLRKSVREYAIKRAKPQ